MSTTTQAKNTEDAIIKEPTRIYAVLNQIYKHSELKKFTLANPDHLEFLNNNFKLVKAASSPDKNDAEFEVKAARKGNQYIRELWRHFYEGGPKPTLPEPTKPRQPRQPRQANKEEKSKRKSSLGKSTAKSDKKNLHTSEEQESTEED